MEPPYPTSKMCCHNFLCNHTCLQINSEHNNTYANKQTNLPQVNRLLELKKQFLNVIILTQGVEVVAVWSSLSTTFDRT